jgi:acyl carrier protein
MADHFEAVRDLLVLMLGVAPDTITRGTAREDCATWDSLAHVNLMLALEDAFHVTLTLDDVAALNSVAAILDRLGTAAPSR